MNINGIYECDIYQIINIERHPNYIHRDAIFVKKALIYKSELSFLDFYDFKTVERYVAGFRRCDYVGQFFVNLKKSLVPVSSIIDYKKENMSKRKILKKYKEVENGGRKE